MFYDEQGKHVLTKKERLDKNGNIRKGCKTIKKGEIYERNIFTTKNKLFKSACPKTNGTRNAKQTEDTAKACHVSRGSHLSEAV